MPHFDLRNPSDRAALGLPDNLNPDVDGDTVSIPSHQRRNLQKHTSRAVALSMILQAVKAAREPMTRLQIARAIGKAKSPHSIGLIMALVESGDLTETAHVKPNGLIEYLYTWGG